MTLNRYLVFLSKIGQVLFLGEKIPEPCKPQGLGLGPLEPTPQLLRPALHRYGGEGWGSQMGWLTAQRGEKDPGNRVRMF